MQWKIKCRYVNALAYFSPPWTFQKWFWLRWKNSEIVDQFFCLFTVPLTQAMTADIPGTMWLMPTARFTFSSASLGHSAHRQHSGYQGRQMWQSSVFSIDLYATMPFGHIVEHWYLHCVCSVLSPLLFARLQFVFTNNPLLPGLLILVSFCPLSHQLFVFRFSLFFFGFIFPFTWSKRPKNQKILMP